MPTVISSRPSEISRERSMRRNRTTAAPCAHISIAAPLMLVRTRLHSPHNDLTELERLGTIERPLTGEHHSRPSLSCMESRIRG